MFGLLKGKKTYVTGVMALLGVLAGVLVGDVMMADAAQMALTAVLGMTIRNGIG